MSSVSPVNSSGQSSFVPLDPTSGSETSPTDCLSPTASDSQELAWRSLPQLPRPNTPSRPSRGSPAVFTFRQSPRSIKSPLSSQSGSSMESIREMPIENSVWDLLESGDFNDLRKFLREPLQEVVAYDLESHVRACDAHFKEAFSHRKIAVITTRDHNALNGKNPSEILVFASPRELCREIAGCGVQVLPGMRKILPGTDNRAAVRMLHGTIVNGKGMIIMGRARSVVCGRVEAVSMTYLNDATPGRVTRFVDQLMKQPYMFQRQYELKMGDLGEGVAWVYAKDEFKGTIQLFTIGGTEEDLQSMSNTIQGEIKALRNQFGYRAIRHTHYLNPYSIVESKIKDTDAYLRVFEAARFNISVGINTLGTFHILMHSPLTSFNAEHLAHISMILDRTADCSELKRRLKEDPIYMNKLYSTLSLLHSSGTLAEAPQV